jgi:hypothetical protein
VRRRRQQTKRERLAIDVESTRLLMVATIADARRLEASVPIGITASVDVWRYWRQWLETWADVEQ